MREKSCMTRNLIFLFIGLLLIYMLQKNGNFFPVFFLISSLFLIYRNRKEKRKVDKIDVLIGLVIIFKNQLTSLVNSIFGKITSQAGSI